MGDCTNCAPAICPAYYQFVVCYYILNGALVAALCRLCKIKQGVSIINFYLAPKLLRYNIIRLLMKVGIRQIVQAIGTDKVLVRYQTFAAGMAKLGEY
jgi:hypothetical protein